VRIPVGRRSAIGVVVGHSAEPSVGAAALKAVHELIDREPLVDDGLMQLLHWSANYYHHPLGEVIASALPRLLKEGAPAVATQALWRLKPDGREALRAGITRRAPHQSALMQLLAQQPCGMAASAIEASLPRWRTAAAALRKRGWVESFVAEAAPQFDPAADARFEAVVPPALSAEQSQAVTAVDGSAGRYEAFVLWGATGCGKTEVYLQCAARTLERGGSVLMLVPEIGLTPQLVARVEQRLRAPRVVLHSGLTDVERLSAWRRARSGQACIVLGTRSAVFAPLSGLQLIIVDEEHDGSYKQYDGGCRYSARDLAVVRAHQLDIPVLLGSATPSFETLHNIERGRYRLLRLPRRSDQSEAPALALVDLRTHAMRQGLATPVIEAIRRHLTAHGQVLVFINRRGYAPTLLCTACGWIAPCPDCDARLTVHRGQARLSCHHCGHLEPLPAQCPRCGFAVKPVGQGTERIEETLRQLFPLAPLLRLDRDTAQNSAELQTTMRSVESGETRILVGTQMVTKGHHFPGVSLVIVLNADHGLFSTDYRAAERLAQTIVQVAGRAGREQLRGEVLIQTEYPDHPLLQSLLHGGYEAFAAAAMAEREAACWPPFSRLAMLRASSVKPDGALSFLSAVRAQMPATSPGAATVRVLGPVPAAMARRAGRHYAQLLLECGERASLHHFIEESVPTIERLARAHRVRFALDVDPLEVQ
jgi:primosomal protein N' (replication factor Y)